MDRLIYEKQKVLFMTRGRSLENIRIIRNCTGLRKILPLKKVPSAEEAFRLIVERRPYQKMMFEKENIEVKYNVIATDIKGVAIKILRWYNLYSESIEKRINDLKVGFGMERMPRGKKLCKCGIF